MRRRFADIQIPEPDARTVGLQSDRAGSGYARQLAGDNHVLPVEPDVERLADESDQEAVPLADGAIRLHARGCRGSGGGGHAAVGSISVDLAASGGPLPEVHLAL